MSFPWSGTLAGQSYNAGYEYDANGNRALPNYQTGPGNELLTDGTYNYTYDKDGNTLTQTTIATGNVIYFTWDYRNRLTEEKEEDSHGNVLYDEKFTYDMNDNRLGVSLNGVQQLWTVYDGNNPYLDFTGSGQLTQRCLSNPNALNQFYDQVSGSGTTAWFLTDIVNSIRQVISSNGTLLDAIPYDPFGNIVYQTNGNNAPRFLYTGASLDPLTAVWQDGEREEDPEDGRWLSQDPTGLGPDSNPYRDVGNDPTNEIDPRGLARFRIGGRVFFVHNNDPDPFPSAPHAHMGGPNSTTKVDINTGQIYNGTTATGKYIPKKILATLRQQMRGRGLLCAAFAILLATPGIVQAGQQGGPAGAAQAAGGVVVDTAIGIGESTVVGLGVTSTATAVGTTVTVSGTAVTGIAGATGVGGAVIITATGGYAVGNAIGGISVGGQTVHDHIANGIIAGLNFVGLW